MKPIQTVAAIAGTLALLGAVGAAAASGNATALDAPDAASGSGSTARAESTASSSPFRPTCGPGPYGFGDMETAPGGYIKAPSRGATDRREFYFTRIMYTDTRWGGPIFGDGGPAWSIDYPGADRTMVAVAKRLSSVDACEWENPVSLADPDLRRFPFIYSLEWGYAWLTDAEVVGLRNYLEAGGFLMLDDFWGTAEWAHFERQMRRVLPDREIVDIPRDHVIFRSYYDIDGEILQVPNAGNGRAIGRGFSGARTSERDGYEAHLRGIFDDRGRLMVAINWNTDLGDALEWAEDPYYPVEFSAFASRLFMNHIIYAMTH
jgi:hypothetical protein